MSRWTICLLPLNSRGKVESTKYLSHVTFLGRQRNNVKPRILHQHMRLGEELPGLQNTIMKNIRFDKAFFEKAFSVERMESF